VPSLGGREGDKTNSQCILPMRMRASFQREDAPASTFYCPPVRSAAEEASCDMHCIHAAAAVFKSSAGECACGCARLLAKRQTAPDDRTHVVSCWGFRVAVGSTRYLRIHACRSSNLAWLCASHKLQISARPPKCIPKSLTSRFRVADELVVAIASRVTSFHANSVSWFRAVLSLMPTMPVPER